MRWSWGYVLCLTMPFGNACGGPESILPPDACSPDVALTASAGTSPTFSWAPDCASGRLEIIHVHTGDLMWGVAGGQTSAAEPPAAIYSGVNYGEVPPQAFALGQLALLSAGQLYQAKLFIVDQRGAAMLVGSRTFSP